MARTGSFAIARRALMACVVTAAAGGFSLIGAAPVSAVAAPGTVVLTSGEVSGTYFAGFCADPGLPVAGSLTCSDGRSLVGGAISLSPGTPQTRSLPAGTYRAAIGNPPSTLGQIGTVEVLPGLSISCSFTLAAAPSCGATPGPLPGTLAATVGETSGSGYATGLCLAPLTVQFSPYCSDNATLAQITNQLAFGQSFAQSVAPGSYSAALAIYGMSLGAVGPVTIESGMVTTCVFTMAAPPACAVTATYAASGPVAANGSVSTVPAGGQTQDDPIGTVVTSPVDGTVAIVESTDTSSTPPGYTLFGQQVTIAAPAASVAAPLSITFHLDSSVLPSGETEQTIQLFHDGVAIAECTDAPQAVPDPCIAQHAVSAGGEITIRVLSSHASVWNFGVLDDSTAPMIAIASPSNGSTVVLGATVAAAYGCTDEPGGSGVASCVGTVATGASVDTTAPGLKTFTVTTADLAGNTRTTTVSYRVVYVASGFRTPIDNDVVNSANSGQAIPVKWRVTDNGGSPISDPSSFVEIRSRGGLCGSQTTDEIEAYAPGASGLVYKGNGEWQFNWKTDKGWKGQCRTLELELADGTLHTARFAFTK